MPTPPPDDRLVEEQGHADHVGSLIRRQIGELRARIDRLRHRGHPTAVLEMFEKRANELEAVSHEPVIGRVDLVEPDRDVGSMVHIGKRDLDRSDGSKALVDWRTPFARERFYEANPANPSGVGRRTTIRMRMGRVTGVVDDLLVPGFRPRQQALHVVAPPGVPSLPEPPAASVETAGALAESGAEAVRTTAEVTDRPGGPADVDSRAAIRAYDLVLDELAASRTGHMADIVATIQADQYRLVTAPVDRPLLIQGGPGTGKTAVALHRAAYVLYEQRQHGEQASVLVVGPSDRFLDYIGTVLPSLGESRADQVSIDDLALATVERELRARIARQLTGPTGAEAVKAGPEMAAVIHRAVWSHFQPADIDLRAGPAQLRIAGSEVRAAAERLRDAGVAWRDGRTALSQVLQTSALPAVDEQLDRAREAGRFRAFLRHRREDRVGIGTQDAAVRRAEIALDLRRAVDAMFPKTTPHAVLRRLLGDRHLAATSTAALSAEARAAFLDSLAANPAAVRFAAEDLPLLDEAAALLGVGSAPYDHVIVDEAQDLTPMQWRVIRRRVRGVSITVGGDLAQATRSSTPRSWQQIAEWAGLDDATIAELALGYRVPAEVMEYASRLLPAMRLGVAPPKGIRSGAGPDVRQARAGELAATVAEELVGAEAGTTAVIGLPEHLGPIADAISRQRPRIGGQPDVALLSPTEAKGLEFDRVVVVEPKAILAERPNGLGELYVALTRATDRLSVVHTTGNLPAVLR